MLTGRGRYLADISLPGMLQAAFVRSPFPHAAINGIDTTEARKVPGVVAVLTADDLALPGLQCVAEIPGYLRPVFSVLASDRVRITGDPVAIVVAESRHAAEDGCDAVEVDYDPLPAVATIEHALDPSVPPIFDDVPSNVFYTEEKTFGDPDSAFEGARIVSLSLRPQRVAMVPMESRGGIADYDPGTGDLTFYSSNQAPHGLRFHLARVLDHPLDRLRVISPDMGGSFGQKTSMWREDLALCVASKRLGRPVRWVEDRIENMTSATHARDERVDVDAAVTDDGTILALDVRMTLDQGAYPLPTTFSPLFGWVGPPHDPVVVPAAEHALGVHRRGDQQGLVRRLPRPVGRRDAPPRADRRPGRARARPRSGRRAPPQPDHGRRAADHDDHGADARGRHLAGDARARRRAARLRGLPRGAAPRS